MHWRWIALLDFTLAAINLFIAWRTWSPVSLINVAGAAFCALLGVYALHQLRAEKRRQASRDEEARIQYLRDNFPWN